MHPQSLFRRALFPAAAVLWLSLLAAGFYRVAQYSLHPGDVAVLPNREWPAGLPFERSPDHNTLVVTLHPECPCSRATLEEVSRISSHVPDLQVITVFEDYETALPEKVEESALWEQAKALVGNVRIVDHAAKIASLFGTRTSGEVRLFSPAGALLFSGGVTGSRGHAGANPASDKVISLATGETTSPQFGVPTFGCALDSSRN